MFTREDWTLFRNPQTLGQKAGVPAAMLASLVVKELVDNALDAGAEATVEKLSEMSVVIDDDGPGIDPGMLEDLFSIRRPLTSTKIIRMPQRGALGNGLRVVMGGVYCSEGTIVVETHGGKYQITPLDSGYSDVKHLGPSDKKQGTRITVTFGDALGEQRHILYLAKWSINFAGFGTKYKSRTSAWWYDLESFFELLQAAGETPVAQVLKHFREMSPNVIAELCPDPYLQGRQATKDFARTLMASMRRISKEVPPASLGSIGELSDYSYAKGTGTISVGTHPDEETHAKLPYVIECYMQAEKDDAKDSLTLMVNRTQITGRTYTSREKKDRIAIFGAGLRHNFLAPKVPVHMIVNVTIPYMPITTDGKEPDLRRLLDPLAEVISKAGKKIKKDVQKKANSNNLTQKQYIEMYLDQAIRKCSGADHLAKPLRYSLRQLYYAIRPLLLGKFENGLDYNYFASVITQIESERGGDLPGIYRDPRGVIYHPHTGEEIPLGTINVEKYERPKWTFNKILYSEKEGLFPILQSTGWPERNDCALMTSKGFASRAARDVIDMLEETGEDIYFYCIHDADAAGTMIYQSLTEATLARGSRKVHVVNLGLDPEEGVEMGLEVETFRDDVKRKLPVADYLRWSYGDWENWLQTQRIELNAMTSPQFIEWLDSKFADQPGKVIPPDGVLLDTYNAKAEAELRSLITAKILEENNFEDKVNEKLAVLPQDDLDLKAVVETGLEDVPENRWDVPLSDYSKLVAQGLVK